MLTYGGVPLLVPDRGGELHRWIEQHFDFENAEIFSDTPEWMLADRTENRDGNVPYVGLPVANYPAAPPPRLNTIWWPTGATRWARGYFLVTEESLKKLLDDMQGIPRLRTLKTTAENGYALSLNLWALSPRKLTLHGNDPLLSAPYPLKGNDDQFYLLPLVDKRYLWQYKSVDTTFTDSTTWESLFAAIGSALGESITVDSIDSRFLRPAYEQFNRIRDNAALMLDAAALSIGHRVIHHWPSNSIVVRSASRAQDFLAYNLDARKEWAQGGFHRLTAKPALVRVNYPRSIDGEVVEGVTTSLTYFPTDRNGTLQGTEKQVFSTAYEERPGGDFDECSTQYTLLECLTKAIGESYYDWLEKRFTFAYPGISGWTSFGIENAITWEFSRPHADGITSETRIDSLPDNFGALYQLSQLPPDLLATTTTSTTASPVSSCEGRCKWIWNASDLEWTKDTDGCGTTSTTTSTSTTEGPETTTTSNPCACTSTTPEPTTTTTPEPCNCVYPVFCGSEDGECTYTFCATGQQPSLNCGQSTTTTTTENPCDCTTAAPCTGDCTWLCTPNGWIKTGGVCSDDCTCGEPEGDCNDNLQGACSDNVASTPCTRPTPAPYGDCLVDWRNQCIWWFYAFNAPDTHDRANSRCWEGIGCWYRLTGTDYDGRCESCADLVWNDEIAICCCASPSSPGQDCARIETPCNRQLNPNPPECWQCRTTSSSTTTTFSPCREESCIWQWSTEFEQWQIQSSSCPEECPCTAPSIAGQDDCERARTPCGGGTTSSTTTTEGPTTTTSTTTSTTAGPTTTTTAGPTTTTTTAPPRWWCFEPSCSDGPGCALKPALYAGDICSSGPFVSYEACASSCSFETTTTTAAPTTTTAAPGSWYCYSGNSCIEDAGVGAVSGPYATQGDCCTMCGGC